MEIYLLAVAALKTAAAVSSLAAAAARLPWAGMTDVPLAMPGDPEVAPEVADAKTAAAALT